MRRPLRRAPLCSHAWKAKAPPLPLLEQNRGADRLPLSNCRRRCLLRKPASSQCQSDSRGARYVPCKGNSPLQQQYITAAAGTLSQSTGVIGKNMTGLAVGGDRACRTHPGKPARKHQEQADAELRHRCGPRQRQRGDHFLFHAAAAKPKAWGAEGRGRGKRWGGTHPQYKLPGVPEHAENTRVVPGVPIFTERKRGSRERVMSSKLLIGRVRTETVSDFVLFLSAGYC